MLYSDWHETLEFLTKRYLELHSSSGQEQRAQQQEPLARLLELAGQEWRDRADAIQDSFQQGGTCDACASAVRVLLVTPSCTHLLCVDCASQHRERCTACSTAYQMQVGWAGAGAGPPGRAAPPCNRAAAWGAAASPTLPSQAALPGLPFFPQTTARGRPGAAEGQPTPQVARAAGAD